MESNRGDNRLLLLIVAVFAVFALYSSGAFDGSAGINDVSVGTNDISANAVYTEDSSDTGLGVTGFASLTQTEWPHGVFCTSQRIKGTTTTLIGTYKDVTNKGMLYAYRNDGKIPVFSFRYWEFGARGLTCKLESAPGPKIDPRTGLLDYETPGPGFYTCIGGNSIQPYGLALSCKQCENKPGDRHDCFKGGYST